MKAKPKFIYIKGIAKSMLLVCFILLVSCPMYSQNITVLPQNGSYAPNIAPQGAFKYQRQFYLITPNDMQKSGLLNGPVNSIGFTIGDAQSDTTLGGFKVYLENTADTISRNDSAFSVINTSSNSYLLTGLLPGIYEVEVISNCGGNAAVDTASLVFRNLELTDCNPPTHLLAANINPTTVDLNWVSPASTGITDYEIQYRKVNTASWNSVFVGGTSTNKTLTGLDAQSFYEWRVKTICGSMTSDFIISSFQTPNVTVACNSTSGYSASVLSDSSATLSWNQVSGAVYYNIRYKRIGTSTWASTISFSGSVTVNGLKAGTTYEWQIRTKCSAGDGPYLAGGNFTTNGTVACYSPESIYADSLTSTSALINWASTGGSYILRYRLKNSIDWTNAITGMQLVHNDSIVIPKTPGPYDIDFAGTGISTFNYTGGGVYVAYEYIYQERCTVNVTINTDSLGAETTFELRDANTNNLLLSGGPYTNGSMSTANSFVCVPEGTDLDFTIYDSGSNGMCCDTGNGSYAVSINATIVASGASFGSSETSLFNVPVSNLPSKNISLCNDEVTKLIGKYGQDSITYIMSLGSNSNDALPSKLVSNSLRPETRFGSVLMVDNVEVSNVYTMGSMAIPYDSPTVIKALIKNKSTSSQIYPVTLTIKDQSGNLVIPAETKNDTLPANSSKIITFTSWSPDRPGTDSIIVSIPQTGGENVTNNNKSYYLSKINKYNSSYADDSKPMTSAGFGAGNGLLLNKHYLNGCGKINSAKVYLNYSCEGQKVKAVLLRAGAIIDTSAAFIPGSSDINKYHTFYFNSLPTLMNTDYYIGLEQSTSTGDPYNPVGVQWEGTAIRSGTYYRAAINGTGLTDTPSPGRLMISAQIIEAQPQVTFGGSPVLCPGGGTTNLSAFPTTTNFVKSVAGSSNPTNVNELIGTPDVFPANNGSGTWSTSPPLDSIKDYLILNFEAGKINFIDIYETIEPGAVDTVYIKDNSNNFVKVYSNNSYSGPTNALKRRINFASPSFDVSQIKITLNSSQKGSQSAIDAVAIGFIDSTNTTGASFTWSPSGDTTQSITVSNTGTQSVAIDYGSSCSSSASTEVTNFVPVLPTITANGATSICRGQPAVVLTSSELTNNHWSTGDTTRSIKIDSSIVSSQNYKVWLSDGSGCAPDTSAPTFVEVHALPVVSITGKLTICPGESTTLGLNTTYSQYNWSTAETTSNIVVSTSGSFSVSVTDVNGCSGSNSVFTFLVGAPNPSISGKLLFCPNESTTLQANSGYSQYLWSNPTSATTSSINVFKASTFTVTVTDVNGCTGEKSATTQLYAPVNPIITGDTSICQNVPTILNAGNGYQSYLWSTGQASQAISVGVAGTFTVTVTDSTGCSGSANATTTLSNSIPGNVGQIMGSTVGLCNQSGVTYSVAPVANTTYYLWTVPAQSTIISGQGTSTITVDFGTLSGIGFISCVASNACGQSAVSTIQISSVPSAPGQIVGQTTGLCNQSGKVYSIAPVPGATSYNWTVPYGATIVSGQGTTTITVNYLNLIPGTIMVTANSPCGQSTGSSLAITCAGCSNPPSLLETHSDVTCNGDGNGSIDISLVGGVPPVSYTWSNGSTTQDLAGLSGGVYTVTVTDSEGCSASLPVIVMEPPAINSTIFTNDTTAFCPQVWALLEAPLNASYTYQWYRFGNPISGATSNTYLAKQSGPHICIITSSTGCSDTSNTIVTTRLTAPSAIINEASPFSICGTNPGGYLTAVTNPGYSYEWLRYGKLAPGINTDSIYHVTKNGNYKLRVTNVQGCFAVSSKVVVKKNRLPKAVVSPSGTLSACVGDSILLYAIATRGTPPYLNYQWYRYNNVLIGQTADSIIVTSTGGYSVQVTDSKGCTDKSPRTVVDFVGCPRFDTNINNTSFEVTAYPNPFMDEVTLQLEEYSNQNVRILIWDALGKEVVKMDEPPGYQYLINTSELISGIYFVEVYQGVNVKRLKLVKTE